MLFALGVIGEEGDGEKGEMIEIPIFSFCLIGEEK